MFSNGLKPALSGFFFAITWLVKGVKEGNYIISVSVSGDLDGFVISAEDSASVKIEESFPRGRVRQWPQNLFEFFQKWFAL